MAEAKHAEDVNNNIIKSGLEAANNITLKDPQAKFRSRVWKYFGFVSADGVKDDANKDKNICKLCMSSVSYKARNTSNMSTHLKRKHGVDISMPRTTPPSTENTSNEPEKATGVTGQLRLQEVLGLRKKIPLQSPRGMCITKAIGGFLAKDMRPFSVIENEGFKHLLNTLEPRYEIPSRTFMTRTIMPSIKDSVIKRIKESLNTAESVSLTTDGWTSRSTQSYIAITTYFLDPNFEMKNYTLQARQLCESHTGENLAKVLEEAIEAWDLKRSNPVSVTTDNASNIVSGVSVAEGVYPHIRCFADTLNLATQRVFMLGRWPVYLVMCDELSIFSIGVLQQLEYFHRSRNSWTFHHTSSSWTSPLAGTLHMIWWHGMLNSSQQYLQLYCRKT
jgi:hypothetical protein